MSSGLINQNVDNLIVGSVQLLVCSVNRATVPGERGFVKAVLMLQCTVHLLRVGGNKVLNRMMKWLFCTSDRELVVYSRKCVVSMTSSLSVL